MAREQRIASTREQRTRGADEQPRRTYIKRRLGRPDERVPELTQRIRDLAAGALTLEEMADHLGLGPEQLRRLMNTHLVLRHAYDEGRASFDARVEHSLYAKAIAGDNTAMIFWLKNRQPARWRDKIDVTADIDVHHTVEVTSERKLAMAVLALLQGATTTPLDPSLLIEGETE